MRYYPSDNALIIKSWCDNPEEQTIEQARHLARLPFAFKQICLMPDTHCGYGMPIGGVMATKDYVVSNAVGVDIGCGMCATKTSLTEIDRDALKKIMGKVRRAVPVGFEHHAKPQDSNLMPELLEEDFSCHPVVHSEYKKALHSLGTLGGGNHFIEFQRAGDGSIWVMIHSGSRNLGKQVAERYDKEAISLNAKYFSSVPKEWELAFLPLDHEIGKRYLFEMQYCVEYALANRKLMMDRICEIVQSETQVTFEPMINIAHNYAAMEEHYGERVLVHRKGATLASQDTIGIIPGSQGTSSYIVRGKGNPESFQSCSHGAGRKMGRGAAKKQLSLEEETRKLDERGILHGIRTKEDLDEAAGAYKDIQVVMHEQEDLVEILVKLEPLAVIKG